MTPVPPALLVSQDVSGVAPLDGRAAVRCPMRVHLRIDPPAGLVPAPVPEVLQARFEDGRAFEALVLGRLRDRLGGDLVHVDGNRDATAAAMAEGALAITGGRLVDEVHKRVGHPDLLLRVTRRPDGRWGYLPVDVKAHLLIRDRARDHLGPVRAMPLEDVGAVDPTSLLVDETRWARRHPRDQMQLAHDHRLLQAAGHELPDGAWGAVIGSEELLVVYDLDHPGWQSWRTATGRWTTLERYDHEFGFRLDVAAIAHARAAGADVEPRVVPALSSECATCEFRDHCVPQMEAADELTLLPGVDWDLRHRLVTGHGVTTRRELAALPADAVTTKAIAAARDQARVVVAGAGPCRARGVDALDLPRADVEVDVDLECSADGRVYLWGSLVHGTDDDGYVAFADLGPDLDDVGLFQRFWAWFTGLRATTLAAGRTFAAYCYFAGSENRFLTMYGGMTGLADEVAELLASPHWVDLHRIVRTHLVTGGSRSLKAIAPLAGFAWRDPEASGGLSMLWYAEAAAGDQQMARRLLAYNEDDVRATAALRDWLTSAWADLPTVDDLTLP